MGSFDTGFLSPRPDGKKRLSKLGSNTVITPSTVDQPIPMGYYGGNLTDGKIVGDANHIPSNIKLGVTDFGITGTFDQTTLIPGTFLFYSDDTYEHSGTATSYVLIKGVQVNTKGGVVRVSFSLYTDGPTYSTYARIYVNGVARGIERSTTATSGSPVSFSEDITINAGDLIQVYAYNTGGSSGKSAYVGLYRLTLGNIVSSIGTIQ